MGRPGAMLFVVAGRSCWDSYAAVAVSEAALASLASRDRTGVVMKDRPPFCIWADQREPRS